MTFRTTFDIPADIASTLLAALLTFGVISIFVDVDRAFVASAVSFVLGQFTSLWVAYRKRDRPNRMCPDHPGQVAGFCGPCRSVQK